MIYSHLKFSCLFVSNFLKLNTKVSRSLSNFFHKIYTPSIITAGIVIIGDEILKGTSEINSPFLIEQLNAINVEVAKVAKVAFLPDNVNLISDEVCQLSSKCSFLITSGGIGPTHDDVTYEAVAKACGDDLYLNRDLVNLMVNYLGSRYENNPGVLKYATIPKSAILNYIDINHNNKFLKYPIVSVRNIYIFPGVPILLQKCFSYFKSIISVQNRPSFSKDIFIDLDEFLFTNILNKAVEKFHNRVKFGSYPTFTDNRYKVKLVLNSSCNDYIEQAYKFLKENLPKSSIVDI